jgi:hypothetical protein
MRWFDVDGARDYLAECGFSKLPGGRGRERRPSRRVLYDMVTGGMKVARLGDSGRRLVFCAEWIDEYLQRAAEKHQAPELPIALLRSRVS